MNPGGSKGVPAGDSALAGAACGVGSATSLQRPGVHQGVGQGQHAQGNGRAGKGEGPEVGRWAGEGWGQSARQGGGRVRGCGRMQKQIRRGARRSRDWSGSVLMGEEVGAKGEGLGQRYVNRDLGLGGRRGRAWGRAGVGAGVVRVVQKEGKRGEQGDRMQRR